MMLDWNWLKVDFVICSGVCEDVKLKRFILFYMIYVMVWFNVDGVVYFCDDIYDCDDIYGMGIQVCL